MATAPTPVTATPDTGIIGETCVVCLCLFNTNEYVIQLQCEHWFHYQCIVRTFAKQCSPYSKQLFGELQYVPCPQCRTESAFDAMVRVHKSTDCPHTDRCQFQVLWRDEWLGSGKRIPNGVHSCESIKDIFRGVIHSLREARFTNKTDPTGEKRAALDLIATTARYIKDDHYAKAKIDVQTVWVPTQIVSAQCRCDSSAGESQKFTWRTCVTPPLTYLCNTHDAVLTVEINELISRSKQVLAPLVYESTQPHGYLCVDCIRKLDPTSVVIASAIEPCLTMRDVRTEIARTLLRTNGGFADRMQTELWWFDDICRSRNENIRGREWEFNVIEAQGEPRTQLVHQPLCRIRIDGHKLGINKKVVTLWSPYVSSHSFLRIHESTYMDRYLPCDGRPEAVRTVFLEPEAPPVSRFRLVDMAHRALMLSGVGVLEAFVTLAQFRIWRNVRLLDAGLLGFFMVTLIIVSLAVLFAPNK